MNSNINDNKTSGSSDAMEDSKPLLEQGTNSPSAPLSPKDEDTQRSSCCSLRTVVILVNIFGLIFVGTSVIDQIIRLVDEMSLDIAEGEDVEAIYAEDRKAMMMIGVGFFSLSSTFIALYGVFWRKVWAVAYTGLVFTGETVHSLSCYDMPSVALTVAFAVPHILYALQLRQSKEEAKK